MSTRVCSVVAFLVGIIVSPSDAEDAIVFRGAPSRMTLCSSASTFVDSTCADSKRSQSFTCTIVRSDSGKLLWASKDSTELTLVVDGPMHFYVAKNGRGRVILEAFAVEAGGKVSYTEVYTARPVLHAYFGEGTYYLPPKHSAGTD